MQGSNWGISDSILMRNAVMAVGAFLLVWFVIMAITGIVACRQGRDDGLWAVVAIFVGPIALLILLIAPRNWLRRTGPDPTTAIVATAPEWPAHEDGWLTFSSPRPTTIEQRLLGALLGGALAGGSAALLVAADGQPIVSMAPVVWTMAGAVVGYVLSGVAMRAEGPWTIGVGAAAGALVIAIAQLLVGLMNAIEDLSGGAVGIFSIMMAILASVVAPFTYALFAQGVVAAALGGGVVWAAVMRLLPHRADEPVVPAAARG